MLHNRRSLSIESAHDLVGGEYASSQSQVSMASELHENIDLDETEQSLMEVAALRKHISLFESKITKSEKILQKRQDEHIKNIDQLEGAKIYELDIYGLDFLHNAMTDFLNNLEMSLHKFGYVEQEIENIR